MDLTVKGYFRNYLKKYKRQKSILSLDDTKYPDDRGTKKEKSRMDFIADSSNPYERSENISFSSNMMQILLTLSPKDLSFIMLKYQENYNDEDLAIHFSLTLHEIKQKEIEILSLLKNNDPIKKLEKRRSTKK